MLIKLENVSYVYSPGTPMEQSALSNVDLEIDRQEFLGIIGHTGSGKSTLIQHFNALLTPTEGRVFVDDIDTKQDKNKLKQIRQKVGLVFQYPEHQLFEESVEDDIAFGPRNLGLSEAEVEERVKSSLETVGLTYESIKDRSPFDLSGGQMRRVAIAGVLAMRPEVLILDEPTAGLDPQGKREILKEIETFYHKLGLTVIMVTHSMEDVARLAGRLLVMNEGAIELEGSPQEIFQNSGYLESLGLGVPEITKLMRTLNDRGVETPTDIFTVSSAKDALLNLFGKQDDTYV